MILQIENNSKLCSSDSLELTASEHFYTTHGAFQFIYLNSGEFLMNLHVYI